MSHVPHDLHADFPELSDRIHDLKVKNAHFAKLLGEYDEVNHKVHLAETNVEPRSPVRETELRKERGHLKDQLYQMLKAPDE
jgi:uncharacterized protein YdcH (DUF465 family)